MIAHAGIFSWGVISIDPVPLVGIVGAVLLYARAVGILAARGRRISRSQQASFYLGVSCIAVATQSLLDPLGEHHLVSAHMAQHLLIADIPAPLLLYGVRAPLVYFFWPRPVLVAAARSRLLRGVWAWLRQPRVALSIWLITLYAWHWPGAYEAALNSAWVHGAEHITFAATGLLAWWPLLDPTHERVVGRVWKALYVIAARMIGGILGVLMIAWPTPWYREYGVAARAYGISPLSDQQLAGTLMMTLDLIIMAAGFLIFIATIESNYDDDVQEPEHPA